MGQTQLATLIMGLLYLYTRAQVVDLTSEDKSTSRARSIRAADPSLDISDTCVCSATTLWEKAL